jgi:hypothetical protein
MKTILFIYKGTVGSILSHYINQIYDGKVSVLEYEPDFGS